MKKYAFLAGLAGILGAGGYFLMQGEPLPEPRSSVRLAYSCRFGGCMNPPLPTGAAYVFEASQLSGASGSLVSSFASMGSITDTATSAAANNSPVLRAAGLNGRSTLSFDGNQDYLTVPNATKFNFVHQTGVFDIFAVYRRPIVGQAVILSNTNFNDTTWPGFWFDLQPGTGGVYGVVTKLGGSTVTTFNSAGTLPIGVWRILEFGGDGTMGYVSTDLRGGAVESQFFANPLATTDPAHFTANIGAHADSNSPLQGDLAALYVYSRKLSAADKDILLAHCKSIWGL